MTECLVQKVCLGGGGSALVSGEKCYSGSGPFLHEKLNVIKMFTWNIIGSSYILYTHTQYFLRKVYMKRSPGVWRGGSKN